MVFTRFSLYLTLLVSVQVCLAGPTTTAPTTPAPYSTLNYLKEQTQKSVDNAISHMHQMLNLDEIKRFNDGNHLSDSIKNISSQFSEQFMSHLSNMTLKGPESEILQTLKHDLTETIEKFQKQIPDLKPSDVGNTINSTIQNIMKEGTKLQTAIEKEVPQVQKNLTKAAETFFGFITNSTNTLVDDIHKTMGHNKVAHQKS